MKVPIIPSMLALAILFSTSLLTVFSMYAWPLFGTAFMYLYYCVHREIFHNGRPWRIGK